MRVQDPSTNLCIFTLGVAVAGAGSGLAALIPVDTLVGALVVQVARLAVAGEAAQQVHAGAVLANVWHHLALIDLLQVSSDRVEHLARTTSST